MPTIDLTQFESPKFAYMVRDVDKYGVPVGDPVEVILDFDATLMELRAACPHIFDPSGQFFAEGPNKGQPIPCIIVALECDRNGERPPEHVAPVSNIVHAVKKTFQMPEHVGRAVALAVLDAFANEIARRSELKKNGSTPPN